MTGKKPASSARLTLGAAKRFSRRTMLKNAAAAGTALAVGPWLVKNAFSSSGELNLLNWSDELPDPVMPNFEAKTGIKVNTTPFSQNEEQINKLQATGGEGFDLCQPTRDRAPQFKDLGVLARVRHEQAEEQRQPAALACSRARPALWTWDGGLYHLPHCWGTEAISWRTDQRTLDTSTSPTARCGTRSQGQGAGPSALAAARHRPVDGRAAASCRRTACSTPSRTRTPSSKIYDEILPVRRSSTSPGSSSSGTAPTTPSPA